MDYPLKADPQSPSGLSVTISGEDKHILKGWESYSGWYWFGIEKLEERIPTSEGGEGGSDLGDGKEVRDTIWFGLVQGFENELGSFSQGEIEAAAPKTWEIKQEDMPSAGRRL